MGKNELSEAGTSMVRDNMANFRRDTRKTRVTGYPGGKACTGLTASLGVGGSGDPAPSPVLDRMEF